jgi:predicted site-specific integrase-resolvase
MSDPVRAREGARAPAILTVTLAEAARLSGLSQATLRRRAAEGRLTLRRVGGRTLVLYESLARLLGVEAERSA